MTTQSVTYCTRVRLDCCPITAVILCVPTAVTLSTLGFLEASLVDLTVSGTSCGNSYYQYTFEYDDAQLVSPSVPIIGTEINGVVCQDCLTRWIEESIFPNNVWLQWLQTNGTPANVLKLSDTDNVQLNALSGQSLLFQIDEVTGWALDLNRDFISDSVTGGNLIINTPNKSFQILNGASLDADITNASPIGRTVQYIGSNADGTNLAMIANGPNASPSALYGFKTRSGFNSWNANAIVANNERIFDFAGWGADGVDYLPATAIYFKVDGAPALGSMPGLIDFLTAPSGSVGVLSRWKVNSTGQILQDATNGSDLVFTKATTAFQLQSGANGRTGTFSLNGATPVVVGNTSLAAGDQIQVYRDTPAGTPGVFNLTARTNGTSFTVTGTALDTSGMRYNLIRIN